MKRSRRVPAVSVLFVCLVLAAPPPPAAAASEAEAPGLSGTWLRSERESDDLQEKVEEAGGRQGRGVSFGRHGGSVGWPGGHVGRGAPPGARSDLDEGLERLAHGLEVVRIERRGTLLQIVDANRETRVVFTDGRTLTDGLGGETTASLREDELVIVTRREGGQRVDTFHLAGERLELSTELQGVGRLPDLTIRTVYERAGAGAVTAPAESPAIADFPVVTTARVVEETAAEPPATAEAVPPAAARPAARAVIRALPPEASPGQLLGGRVEIETLTIDPAVETVEFWLDGELVERRKLPPFTAKVELAEPPREQTVRVVAFDRGGRRLGEDELVLNRLDPPFRVRISSIEGDRGQGSVTVTADVSVPRKAQLTGVAFYLDERQVQAVTGAPFVAEIPTAGAVPESFVRVVATLADGRELEDVELLEGGEFREKIDVHLVQLQVLVTDRSGTPVPGLDAGDFRVVDGGKERQIERLYPSRDVALVLGLAVDSSGSMGPLWQQTRSAAEEFLDGTLGPRDRAFLVDFDDQLRLLQPLTGSRPVLASALDRLQARGGTALYDSILFSLLQFDGEPGRRALVVFTDGFDSGSRADPSRAVDFGTRLGVPVYVVAMGGGAGRMPATGGGAFGTPRGGFSDAAMARSSLRLITDPTGGRLFQVALPEQVRGAFAQIEAELRNQYILMYYTDRAPDGRRSPTVEVRSKGLRVKTAIPLDLAD